MIKVMQFELDVRFYVSSDSAVIPLFFRKCSGRIYLITLMQVFEMLKILKEKFYSWTSIWIGVVLKVC